MWRKQASLAELYNNIIIFDKTADRDWLQWQAVSLQGKYKATNITETIKRKSSDGISFLFKLVNSMILPSAGSFAMMLLLQPDSSLFLYSALPNAWKGYRALFLFYLLENYVLISGWTLYTFYWYMIFMYGKSSTYWLNYIRTRIADNRFGSTPREFGKSIRFYKMIQVLTNQVNYCCRYMFIIPMKTISMGNHTLSQVVLIRYHDAMPAPYLLGFLSLIGFHLMAELITFPALGSVREMSVEIREFASFGRKKDKMEERSLKSLALNEVKVMDFYAFGKHTPLTVISIIISATANILLLIR
ncbi:unnamed protein product [Allacma fusca]|uniref:Uncharacterized protein n=1 Tax=Allacma fusca TaxID=39272 RepID=A0A8J2PRK4_9HEXA|nr:unnamed protein product [Allacma fusca]